MIRKICLLTLLLFKLSFSQDNLPPEIFSEGNEFYCPLSQQAIVTFFDITDPDDESIEALYIQISQGYVQGEDVLSLIGVHPGIQETWDPVSGKLELTNSCDHSPPACFQPYMNMAFFSSACIN